MTEPSDSESDLCKHCNEKYSKESLNDHEQTCEKLSDFIVIKDKQRFQCQLCTETFHNRETAYEHIYSIDEHMESILEKISKSHSDTEEEKGNKTEDIAQNQMPIGKFKALNR